jgi:hypothetical protein
VRNPRRAGSPETDQANPAAPRSPEVQVGRDVIPPKDERAGIVTTSDGPDGLGGTLWRGKAQEGIDGSTSLVGVERQHGLVAGTRPCRRLLLDRPSPSGGGSAGNVRRARTPRGAPLAHEGKTSKGQAHGRSGASRAGRIGGVRRDGGSQTPHAARGGEGIRRLHAGLPVRDCVVGHRSPGEAASRDCHPRRFCHRNRWLAPRCGAAGTRL